MWDKLKIARVERTNGAGCHEGDSGMRSSTKVEDRHNIALLPELADDNGKGGRGKERAWWYEMAVRSTKRRV